VRREHDENSGGATSLYILYLKIQVVIDICTLAHSSFILYFLFFIFIFIPVTTTSFNFAPRSRSSAAAAASVLAHRSSGFLSVIHTCIHLFIYLFHILMPQRDPFCFQYFVVFLTSISRHIVTKKTKQNKKPTSFMLTVNDDCECDTFSKLQPPLPPFICHDSFFSLYYWFFNMFVVI